jgi:predicted nucleotidyltransferase
MDSAARVAAAIVNALAGDPGVVSAYLFGSVARGREHRDSDIDIAVLLDWAAYPTARARFERRLRLIGELEAALRGERTVDLLILNDAPPHLAREVVTRGRRVHGTGDGVDHAFRRTAMLRAADLEPFLRRARLVKLRALQS